MCEYVSFLASDSGPTLQLYFSTGLNSHANIRSAYNMRTNGAECEWVGNSADNLKVRHGDSSIAKLIKHMILDKYPTLKDMLRDICTVRDRDGIPHTVSPDTYLTPEERKDALPSILAAHKLWVKTKEKEGAQADLSWWDLRGANLHGANLRGANLRGANLRGANLFNAILCNADLCNADLCNADLRNAALCYANLCDADLCDADLCNADLCDADLRNADLCDADLYCAKNVPDYVKV